MTSALSVRRLSSGDVSLARETFHLMTTVFEEPPAELSDAYLARLLASPAFWALAALDAGQPVGGLTAHALPMTRRMETELFIYDLAVSPAVQRRGVGRALVEALREAGAREGIRVCFVPADVEDEHALCFYRAIGGAPADVQLFTFEG